jgi:hypothetical protein
MSAALALQEAVFAALAADAGIKALIGDPARLYDDVPRDAAYPYVTIGEAREEDWSTKTEEGSEHRLVFYVWSRYGGRREVKQILSRIRTVLHDASPGVSGYALINLRCEAMEAFRAGDARSYRGVARYRAAMEG